MDLKLAKKGLKDDYFTINNIYCAYIKDTGIVDSLTKVDLYDDDLIDYGLETFTKMITKGFSGNFSKDLYEFEVDTDTENMNKLLKLYYNRLQDKDEVKPFIDKMALNLKYSADKMGFIFLTHCSTKIRTEMDYIDYDFILCTTHKVKATEPTLILNEDRAPKVTKSGNVYINKTIDSAFIYPSLNDEEKDVNHLVYKAKDSDFNEDLLYSLFSIENEQKNKEQKDIFTDLLQSVPGMSYRKYININETIGEKLELAFEESTTLPTISTDEFRDILEDEGISPSEIEEFMFSISTLAPNKILNLEAIYNQTINIKKDKCINISIENIEENIDLDDNKLIIDLDQSFTINNCQMKIND